MADEPLPECRVKARNTSATSENRICDDAVVRQDAFDRGARGFVHPALLDQANLALSRNVRRGPWIHVSSAVRHLGGAWVGDTPATRGRVRSLSEKKGRAYVELELAIVAEPAACPVTHVLHAAMDRRPAPAR